MRVGGTALNSALTRARPCLTIFGPIVPDNLRFATVSGMTMVGALPPIANVDD
jgi:hypothetical protein